MLSKLISTFRFALSIRLKGPASQRQKKDEGVKIEIERVENFFADYSPETAPLYLPLTQLPQRIYSSRDGKFQRNGEEGIQSWERDPSTDTGVPNRAGNQKISTQSTRPWQCCHPVRNYERKDHTGHEPRQQVPQGLQGWEEVDAADPEEEVDAELLHADGLP